MTAPARRRRPSKTRASARRGAEEPSAPRIVVGVDLGSNSFHMVVARVVEGQIHVIDRIREAVRLAAGLDDENRLSKDAQERALTCLRRFAQRVRGIPPEHVRAVGTNTFRQAKGAKGFLRRAEKALGHSIEILPGAEEARLVYLGVAHDLSDDAGRRLVVDIGGGSTECIIGEHFQPLAANSMYMGCVSYTRRFFDGSRIRARDFVRAQIAARLELQAIERRFRGLDWQDCRGSSGTIETVAQIVTDAGWSKDGITPRALDELIEDLISTKVDRIANRFDVDPSRAMVLPGGIAILRATFEALGIRRMRPATGALREGLLYDLLGRIRHEDPRDQTIRRMCERYHVDLEQAGRVERTALDLLEQCGPGKNGHADDGLYLSWAAHLHEIGLSVAYTGYHKHGAYLVEHSDMPGFSVENQRLLSRLILSHRRKVRGVADGGAHGVPSLRLCAIFRLAVLLNRSRNRIVVPRPEVRGTSKGMTVSFPPGWLDQHPLTRADLEEEAERLSTAGFALRIRSSRA